MKYDADKIIDTYLGFGIYHTFNAYGAVIRPDGRPPLFVSATGSLTGDFGNSAVATMGKLKELIESIVMNDYIV